MQELTARAALLSDELWARVEATQPSDESFYEQVDDRHRMIIITVVPVRNNLGTLLGHVKGIYIVTDDLMTEMREDSLGAILVALGSVLVSLLVVFPIILFMQREHAKQTQRVLEGNIALLEVLGNAVAFRDSDTDSHNYRVTLYTLRLAEQLGLDAEKMRILSVGAFLHDVGKIGISDTILLKRGKLTDDEFNLMKKHVSIGVEIVRNSSWLSEAVSVVECHHEKFNGTGYPGKLAGEAIPLEARVFAVADVFDALTSERPYKQPFSLEVALEIMRHDSGTHFDPQVFDCFASMARDLYAEVAGSPRTVLQQKMQALTQRYFATPNAN